MLQHIHKPTLRVFPKHLAGPKQRVHDAGPVNILVVATVQIRLLAHDHVTDASLRVCIVKRHVRYIQIGNELVIVA